MICDDNRPTQRFQLFVIWTIYFYQTQKTHQPHKKSPGNMNAVCENLALFFRFIHQQNNRKYRRTNQKSTQTKNTKTKGTQKRTYKPNHFALPNFLSQHNLCFRAENQPLFPMSEFLHFLRPW